ncbi:MAG: tRNA lysidine(34) synthetase, partial [Gemmataceae bacterium]
IATGHTADDHAETILHRLIRGSSWQGLRGIPAVRPDEQDARLRIVRPLLSCTRADVLTALAEWNQPFCTDASNTDSRFTRNRLRHEVLPVLEALSPGVRRHLARRADEAAELHAGLSELALGVLPQVELPRAGTIVVLHLGPWLLQPALLRREMMRELFAREKWPTAEFRQRHWVQLADLAPGDYPHGVRLERTATVGQLSRRS